MYKLRFLNQAEQDLISIATYISEESGSIEIALHFVEKLQKQFELLAKTPGKIGTLRPELMENIRSFPVGNYVIFFIYEESYLKIVSIIEGHRDIESIF